MAHLLGAEALHLEVPTKVVFDSVTLGIAEGDRIGIVGRNGDGKSSLLMMLAGRRSPDGGKVTVRSGTTIGVLDQADVFAPGETCLLYTSPSPRDRTRSRMPSSA